MLSGCGLFRKSVKTSSSSEHIEKVESKAESKEQIKAVGESESKVVSNERKKVQKNVNEQTILTADEIEVKPDGSIKAKGAVRLDQNRKDKGNSVTNKAVERKDRYVGHIDAIVDNKEQRKQETKDKVKDKQVQSEPKASSFIYFFIGLSLLACVIIWWMRRR